MRRRVVHIDISPASIEAAIKAINEERAYLQRKGDEIVAKLAEIGVQEATVQFTAAAYDGINDVRVHAEPTEKGYAVIAEGEAVCFIEFGAGVAYNGVDAYPGTRPDGILGIGEFGLGHGADVDDNGDPAGWYYPTSAGYRHTYGNPPAAGMYLASDMIRREVKRIVREVFA